MIAFDAKTHAAAIVFASTCIFASTCMVACDEKKETPRQIAIAPTYAQDPSINAQRPTTPAATNNGSPSQAPTSNEPTALDLALADASRPQIIVKRTIETVTPVDPDQAILDAAHMRAASCYDGKVVSNVPRSATINVTVIPTGKVTRAEVVSPDTTEPQVLDCLKSLGEGLVFTERFEQPAKRANSGTGGTGNTGDTKTPTSGSNGGGLRTYAINVAVVPAH